MKAQLEFRLHSCPALPFSHSVLRSCLTRFLSLLANCPQPGDFNWKAPSFILAGLSLVGWLAGWLLGWLAGWLLGQWVVGSLVEIQSEC